MACRPWGTYGVTLVKKLATYMRLLESRLTYIAELVALSAEVFFNRLQFCSQGGNFCAVTNGREVGNPISLPPKPELKPLYWSFDSSHLTPCQGSKN